jgi:hypothetical protein
MALTLPLGALGLGLGFAALRWFTGKTIKIEGTVSDTIQGERAQMESPEAAEAAETAETAEAAEAAETKCAWSRGPPVHVVNSIDSP